MLKKILLLNTNEKAFFFSPPHLRIQDISKIYKLTSIWFILTAYFAHFALCLFWSFSLCVNVPYWNNICAKGQGAQRMIANVINFTEILWFCIGCSSESRYSRCTTFGWTLACFILGVYFQPQLEQNKIDLGGIRSRLDVANTKLDRFPLDIHAANRIIVAILFDSFVTFQICDWNLIREGTRKKYLITMVVVVWSTLMVTELEKVVIFRHLKPIRLIICCTLSVWFCQWLPPILLLFQSFFLII